MATNATMAVDELSRFGDLVDDLVREATDAIKQVQELLENEIESAAKRLGEKLAAATIGWVEDLFTTTKNGVTAVLGELFTEGQALVEDWAKDIIGRARSTVTEWLGDLADTDKIADWAKDALGGIGDTLSGWIGDIFGGGKVSTWVKDLFGDAGEGAFEWVREKLGDDWVGDLFGKGQKKVVDWIGDLFGGGSEKVTEWFEGLFGKGQDEVVGWFKNLFGKIGIEAASSPAVVPVVTQLVGGVAGGNIAGAMPGLGSLANLGGAGALSNLNLGNLFSLSGLTTGSTAVGNLFADVGGWFGGAETQALFGNAGLNLSSFAGIGGGLAGGFLANQLFGGGMGTSIGSTIGSVAGSFIPIPFVGTAIGSLLGGAIGSLFNGKPHNHWGHGTLNLATGEATSRRGWRGNQENLDFVNALLGQAKGVYDLVTGLGGTATGELNLDVANRDGIFVNGRNVGGRNDVEAATEAIYDEIINSTSGLSEVMREAVESASNYEEALANVNAVMKELALEAQAIAPSLQAGRSIQQFLDAQSLSDASSLSPAAKLQEAQRQFDEALVAVRGGDLDQTGALTQAAGTLLALGRQNHGSSVDFVGLEQSVRSTLASVGQTITSESFIDRQVEAIRQQTRSQEVQTQLLRDELSALRRDFQMLGQQLRAA